MKKINVHLTSSICFLLCVSSGYAQLPSADTIKTKRGDITIQPIFHGALVLRFNHTTIYIDPYNGKSAYNGLPAPDLILVTHSVAPDEYPKAPKLLGSISYFFELNLTNRTAL